MKNTILAFGAAIVLAAGGYFTGNLTSGEAVSLALNPENAVSQCTTILKGQGYGVEAPEADDTSPAIEEGELS